MEVTTQTGHYYRVERRSPPFHSLNKQAKKLGLGPLSEFPPKRIRNTSAKVLESRRKGLEHFIQSLAKLQPVPQLLLSFLELPASLYSVTSSVIEVGESEIRSGAGSYSSPVFGYPEDPFLSESDESNDMTSMITEGIIDIGNIIRCLIIITFTHFSYSCCILRVDTAVYAHPRSAAQHYTCFYFPLYFL